MGRRGRVLVVDDEPMIGRLVRRTLAEHDVTAVVRAADALALFDAGERFDAILCDVAMPGMTGIELHAELHRRDPTLCAHFVFLTGGAFAPDIRRALAAIGAPRIDKPFDASTLRDTVGALVG